MYVCSFLNPKLQALHGFMEIGCLQVAQCVIALQAIFFIGMCLYTCLSIKKKCKDISLTMRAFQGCLGKMSSGTANICGGNVHHMKKCK